MRRTNRRTGKLSSNYKRHLKKYGKPMPNSKVLVEKWYAEDWTKEVS